jgi:hypothetical protein
MRATEQFVLIATVLFASCAHEQEPRTGSSVAERPSEVHASTRPGPLRNSAAADFDPASFDIVQRTCALYVAMRSGSLESAVAFGRDIDDTMVHWNVCPSGTMVACASVSDIDEASVEFGIPWTNRRLDRTGL